MEHVEQPEKKGLLLPRSRAVYATGILALWIPSRSAARIDSVDGLVQPAVKVIALAKPELAPHRQALSPKSLVYVVESTWGRLATCG